MVQPLHAIADRLVVVLSDIEMGAGGTWDDFPHDDFLANLIGAYGFPPFDSLAVDLVFNGDTFDFLKTGLEGLYPRRITASVAQAKLDRVLAAHPGFVEGVRSFLSVPDRRAFFVVGNHDLELVFPQVQERLAHALGPGLVFPGFHHRHGQLLIEHGLLADPMFGVDPSRTTIPFAGEEVLALPWGSAAIIDVALPLQRYLFALDRIKPRGRVIELLPEVRDLLLGAYWSYWTRDWWRELRTDPTRTVSWSMLKEIVYRFGTLDVDVRVGDHYRQVLRSDDELRLVVIGHLHQAEWWGEADRKLLTTGCLRDEFVIDEEGVVVGQLPKTYAEVYMRGEQVVRSHLVEVDGPPSPPGHVPDRLQDVLAAIQPLLGSAEARARTLRDARAQEESER